jgi:hypothetical protein
MSFNFTTTTEPSPTIGINNKTTIKNNIPPAVKIDKTEKSIILKGYGNNKSEKFSLNKGFYILKINFEGPLTSEFIMDMNCDSGVNMPLAKNDGHFNEISSNAYQLTRTLNKNCLENVSIIVKAIGPWSIEILNPDTESTTYVPIIYTGSKWQTTQAFNMKEGYATLYIKLNSQNTKEHSIELYDVVDGRRQIIDISNGWTFNTPHVIKIPKNSVYLLEIKSISDWEIKIVQ